MTSKTTADILRERQCAARNGAAPKDRRAADEGGYPGDHVQPIAPEAARQQEQGDAWEPASPEAAAKAAAAIDRSYRLAAVDSRTFFTTPYKLEWLVKRLLIKGQPCIFGGPKKSLKTTELVDLAVSLATATPFLGYFEVYRRCRVVMISGESGEAVLQETGRRICAARGIDPATLDVHWSFRLPKVASVLDRDALALGLQQLGAGVVIIDPLYLCLLAGMDARDVEAGNLFHMGPLLLDLAPRAWTPAPLRPCRTMPARTGSTIRGRWTWTICCSPASRSSPASGFEEAAASRSIPKPGQANCGCRPAGPRDKAACGPWTWRKASSATTSRGASGR